MQILSEAGDLSQPSSPIGRAGQYASGELSYVGVLYCCFCRFSSSVVLAQSFVSTPFYMRPTQGSVSQCRSGVRAYIATFMYATAEDWARLGMLYMQDGVWAGERMLPQGWVDYSRTAAGADATNIYGAHFWLRLPEEYNRSQTPLPMDAMHAIGHEGQFVTILPSLSVVIVRLGKTRYAQAWDHGAFVHSVLTALAAAGEEG